MKTLKALKTSDKVRDAFKQFKKGSIAEHLGMSRNTLKARLKDNSWQDEEIEILRQLNIL